jgi:hypothetical protein
MKNAIKLLMNLTKNISWEIQKVAWIGLAISLFSNATPFVHVIGDESILYQKPNTFKVEEINLPSEFSLIAFEVVKEKLDFLLSSTSPNEVSQELKIVCPFLETDLYTSPTLLKGIFEPNNPLMLNSPSFQDI